jgi:Fe2+ or Zn2+ uptake regulation protein
MYWQCPTCELTFKTYHAATSHDHQVFTTDDAGAVFDIALPPTSTAVEASIGTRLRFRLRQLVV